jgi:hypothetical protein
MHLLVGRTTLSLSLFSKTKSNRAREASWPGACAGVRAAVRRLFGSRRVVLTEKDSWWSMTILPKTKEERLVLLVTF